ncbi:glycine/betaine ABC transporter substrate-binding protein [Paroceanicella profunda]|uniref:Glycine/betaine ABC transporter substrate-binding protein n=1 Tax=Paroceanicella profunda TaxID=2579971 RepID=A0A5B8FX23_9RHOB|nr:glycine betaine ABC transporter substrate-binding protein [Paroceanicella profunda]QDL90992.1 glycine/betaine ABC transporter substrate-binding protein [Paroceanicella profunda]
MSKDPIRVGHIDLSFHDASAHEVERVLAAHGHEIERDAAPHEEMFRRLGRGDVDMLVSAWLPSSHDTYLGPIEDQVMKVTVLYEPYCIWGVPDYVPEDEVASVQDLLRSPVLRRMERLIQGINPGAGISRFSKAIIAAYDLGSAGYHFETGTEAQCFDRFEDAHDRGAWIVVPLWHPQYLHARYRIRELAEPRGLLGGADKATLVVRKDAMSRIAPAALEELSRLTLGNPRVSELDAALRGKLRT